MRLQGKLLTEVTLEDLQGLIDNQIPESPVLDYKQDLPDWSASGWKDNGKKEFLADVSAMANTSGGVLLYGISEKRDEENRKTDLPDVLLGLSGNVAETIQRVEQVVLTGLDPPLNRCIVRGIALKDADAFVLAVGVTSSLLAPHAVRFATRLPFWKRAGSTKYALQTEELRRMILERGTWQQEADTFRRERVIANLEQVNLSPEPALFLHVLPLGRLQLWIDVVAHAAVLQNNLTFGDHLDYRLTFDGIFRTRTRENRITEFIQWFRFGGVEVFTTSGSSVQRGSESRETFEIISPTIYSVEYALKAMNIMDGTLDVAPPYAVMMSVVGVQGRIIEIMRGFQGRWQVRPSHEILENQQIFPAVVFEETPNDVQDVASALRPALDALWQSGNLGRCLMYSQDRWIGRDLAGWESYAQ